MDSRFSAGGRTSASGWRGNNRVYSECVVEFDEDGGDNKLGVIP